MPPCNRVSSRKLVASDCATWPTDLQARWLALFDPGDETSEQPWVRETQYQYASVFTRYLACCARHALPSAMSSVGLRAFIRECAANGNVARTIAGYVWHLSHLVGLLLPEHYPEYAWLRKTAGRLQAAADRTPKTRTAHVVRAPDLGLLGHDLQARARAAANQDAWSTTELFRNGLWLRLGSNNPERLKAQGSIQCSWIDFDARLIRFPAKVEKTPEEAWRALPDSLVLEVEEWMDAFRARWQPKHDFFWIAKGGKPASLSALSAAMRRVTAELPGGPVSPHGLRHGVATFIVESAPEKASLATTILGQRAPRVTREYTERATRIQASRDMAEIVSANENQTRKAVRAATRSTIGQVKRRRPRS